jgi:streptogramin lyase
MSVFTFITKRFGDIGLRKRRSVRKHPRPQPVMEALDNRILMSVTEFPIPDTTTARPEGITRGPDGNLWFTETLADRIGRITPAGVVTQFSLPFLSQPSEITAGPDGNLWFTETGSGRIGRITTAGVITEFSAGITPNSRPVGITRGPDGNLWFTEVQANKVGRITAAGVVTEFSAGITPGTALNLITAGPDGNLWFTQRPNSNAVPGAIGRITPAGVVTEFSAGLSPGGQVNGITTGPDGNLWFTEANFNVIGRITPAGAITEVVANVGSIPEEITTGPDGNLWFTEFGGSGRIGRLTTAGAFTEFAAGISTGSKPFGIAVGPDGNIWFAEAGLTGPNSTIGRLNRAQSPDETTTTLRTSANTAVVGQTVTLTATVTALGGGVVTNGVVDFYNGNTPVGLALLDGNGQATVNVTAVGVGTAALKAVLRSGAFPASTSAVVNVTVTADRAATTVSLASSVNPATAGQAVSFRAGVAVVAPGAGTPTGTVTFKDGSVTLGTIAVGADGTATLTTTFAAAGGHVITAVYNGDANFAGSSQSLTEQVNATTTPAVTATFSAVDGRLTILGDARDNTVVVSRDAAGTILVNNGAVAIQGGPATVTNVRSISINGGDGNDNLSLDEANGALPSAALAGDGGNDTLVGGSRNDTLTGSAGNDTFVRNPGDGSDIIDGGDGADTLVFNGSDQPDAFVIAANGNRVQIALTTGGGLTDLGGIETLTINALGGADTVTVNDLTGIAPIQMNLNLTGAVGGTLGDGQADAVIVNASNGADVIPIAGSFNVSGNVVTVGGNVGAGALPYSLVITAPEGGSGHADGERPRRQRHGGRLRPLCHEREPADQAERQWRHRQRLADR